MINLIFVHNAWETFVRDDLRLLSESFAVTDWYQPSKIINPLRLFRAMRAQDVVLCWFASWHSFLPILFAKWLRIPSIVIVGGYDTANIPEAKYGLQRGGISKQISLFIMRNASLLITTSESAWRETVQRSEVSPEKIKAVYQGLETRYDRIPEKRESLVLTVGGVNQSNLLRKGLLAFVQAASYLPDIKFVLVGSWQDNGIDTLKNIAGPNVTLAGFLSDAELNDLYHRASVYVQASLHEGFGVSVAEAMLAGCIPVIPRVASLPEVVDQYGVYIDSNTPAAIADGIKEALNAPYSLREAAQEHINRTFSMQRRRDALHSLISNLVDHQSK